MTEPRAYTPDEVRDDFLKHLRHMIDYWDQQGGSCKDKMDGLVFSILNIFDGTAMAFPSMDIVVRPHVDDKEFHIEQGDNYYEDGMAINTEASMHEEWGKYSHMSKK